MSQSSDNFVTVDMRGMKAALVARAHAKGVGISTIVRAAVSRELELGADDDAPEASAHPVNGRSIKVSIRLTSTEAAQLVANAREAGLSRGAYVGGLVRGIAVLSKRPDHVAAVTASCGELAILSCNLHHIVMLFRQGAVEAASQYVGMLVSLRVEVRRHLQVAARALADMQPRRTVGVRPKQVKTKKEKTDDRTT